MPWPFAPRVFQTLFPPMNGTLVELSRTTMDTGCTEATSLRPAMAAAACGESVAENALISVP